MYTVEQGMQLIANNQNMIIVAAFITYGFGFLQYGCSMYMQWKNKSCPFYFWMHAWYFGHDFTFAIICFNQWFNVVHWWLFEVLCIGCMAFMLIEAYSFYMSVKNERQEIWGKYTKGKEVTIKYAIICGGIGYIVGIILFASLRAILSDPFCLFLMMSTNAILALNVHRKYDEFGECQHGSKVLAWATLFGTCFTFAPAGIGFFATMVPPLQSWIFTAVGLICVATSIRAIWQAHTYPKHNYIK